MQGESTKVMGKVTRNIIFRLYPTRRQEETLAHWLELHRELYNAALQERWDAYRKCGISLTYNEQQNELPAVKEGRPDLIPLGSHALQETVRWVDRAYKGFFRRVKAGKKPGFPRFKGKHRFDSFAWPDPAGWKIVEQERHKGRLSITNLGLVRMRGKPRVALERGEPRTLTVKRRNDKWYAVISVRYPGAALRRNRAYPDRLVGLDVGCKSLVATSDGDLIENPRHLNRVQTRLKTAQRDLSRKTCKKPRQKYSRRRDRARCKVARLHELVANRRRDHLHQLSAAIVFLYSFIAVEDLDLRNMTRSARGTVEKPGRPSHRYRRQKAGLNRSLLDASMGLLFSMLAYKAVEAGSRAENVIPNGTSQDCFRCGAQVPKEGM